ncbi:hypothetical protein [Paenalcaligenes hermetiae]
MSPHELIVLASSFREAVESQRAFTLPMMSMCELELFMSFL